MEPGAEPRGNVASLRRRAPAEPSYWPTFELASGRVVGADLVASEVVTGSARSAARTASPSVTALAAARAFAVGAPAQQGWWVGIGLRPGQLLAPSGPVLVADLLAQSALAADRLVLHVTEAELAALSAGDGAEALGAIGVGLSILDLGAGALRPDGLARAMGQVRVASLRVDVSRLDPASGADLRVLAATCTVAHDLGIDVVGLGVETDAHLELVARAGVRLVQGFLWGSEGSVAKLVATWARPVARPGSTHLVSGSPMRRRARRGDRPRG